MKIARPAAHPARPATAPAKPAKPAAVRDATFFTDLKTSTADGFYGQVSCGGITFASGLSFHGKDGFVNIVGITADGHVSWSPQNRPGHEANATELKALAAALKDVKGGKHLAGDAQMKHAIKEIATVLLKHAEAQEKSGKPAPLSGAEKKHLASLGWE